jgi:hypothetical protein
LDPLIKSQLTPLQYQWLAGKLLAFSGIADQTVTIQMQTANWDLQTLKATEARWTPPGPDGDGVTSTPSRPAVIEAPILPRKFSALAPGLDSASRFDDQSGNSRGPLGRI